MLIEASGSSPSAAARPRGVRNFLNPAVGYKMDEDTRVVRSPEPISVEPDGGLVMLSVAAGKYFSLNATAVAIWHRLESPI